MKRLSYRIALGGVLSSLGLLAMFMTGLAPFFTYLCPMIAGGLVAILLIEAGTKWAVASYAAVAILSVFTTPDKEAAMIFVFLFGHYPIVKVYLEKIPSRFLEYAVKLAIFNVCSVSCYLVVIYVFGIGQFLESLGDWGQYGLLIFLALANLVFLMYDYCITAGANWYIDFFRPKYLKKR